MKKLLLILTLSLLSATVFADPRWCYAVKWDLKECTKHVEKRYGVHKNHCESQPDEFYKGCMEIREYTYSFATDICRVNYDKDIQYCYKNKSSRKKKKVYHEEQIESEDSVQ